tara:strand:+ start:2675 stop:2866 length:192 start_codon:yes stop_codon:yes gene_type:complete
MRSEYDIVDGRGVVIESSIPDRRQAEDMITMMQTIQNIDTQEYRIVERRVATVKGLGRDPDLH